NGRSDVLHLKNATLSVCVRQTAGGCTLAVLRSEKRDLRYGSSPARGGFPKSTRMKSFSPMPPVRIRLRKARRSYSSVSTPGFSIRKRAVPGGWAELLSAGAAVDSREFMREGRAGGAGGGGGRGSTGAGGGATFTGAGAGSGLGGADGGASTWSRA